MGTSSGVASTEQGVEQDEEHEGVYEPWVVVARRKNGTNRLKSSGTSPKQSTGFSFKENGCVEKGFLDRAGGFLGPTRDAKRKMSPPLVLDKAQIASVVQSLRSEGQKLAHSSPNLFFNDDGNDSPTQPKASPNFQRLSSVKGKKRAARNKSNSGEHNGAAGDDQRRSPVAGANGEIIFSAAMFPPGKDRGWDSSKPKLRQGVIQPQKSSEVVVPGSGLGSSCAMQCEDAEMSSSLAEIGDGVGSSCYEEAQSSHSVGGVLSTSNGSLPSISIPSSGDGVYAAPGASVFRDRPDSMVLEGGGDFEKSQC